MLLIETLDPPTLALIIEDEILEPARKPVELRVIPVESTLPPDLNDISMLVLVAYIAFLFPLVSPDIYIPDVAAVVA